MSETQHQFAELLFEPPAHHHRTSEAKVSRNALRFASEPGKMHKNEYISNPERIQPTQTAGFNGLPIGGAGIPNDNNMAISNDGTVVSVINSSVSIFKRDGGQIRYRTLRTIVGNVLPNLDRTYDPKVMYDPAADRFILVFLQGSTSADTRIITGFSQTSDPDGAWNFYALEGNPFQGKTWSDYPIIAMNDKDLFIIVNILYDDMSWQEGFTQSVVWQVKKQDGYAGDSLTRKLYYDIKYQGVPVWSICPVSSTPETTDHGIYMLSVRPSASENDTLFLHRIEGSIGSGEPVLSMRVLRSDKVYGVPASAFQPEAGFRLQTNDTRVLSGFYHQGHIQYLQSSHIPSNGKPGLYHGIIDFSGGQPDVTAEYITNDSFDMAYPSITSVASQDEPMASVITASYSGKWHYPGTLAIMHRRGRGLAGLYSTPVSIKKGEGVINTFLADSIERWGDYTAVQVKYNERDRVWMSGSYGMSADRNGVWIGEIVLGSGLELAIRDAGIILYPVPGDGYYRLKLNSEKSGNLVLRCTDMSGKVVWEEEKGYVSRGETLLGLDFRGLRVGVYWVEAEVGGEVYGWKLIHAQ